MSWMTLGSLALPFQLNRHAVALRGDLSRLSVEMTTGRAANVSMHLKGDLGPLAALETRARRLESAVLAARSAQTESGIAQGALAGLADTAALASSSLLAVSAQGQDANALRTASAAARLAMDGARGTLAAEAAGRALFSGTRTDRVPLVATGTMMAALAPLVAGATSADQVADAIDAAFRDPGGAFDTQFYVGGGASAGAPLDGDTTGADLPTASEPALRQLLSGLAMAAFAGDDGLPLSLDQRQALVRRASLTLVDAGAGITALQANLGESEGRIAALTTRLEGERSALELARETLIGVDPFEAAGKLQQAQTRLEVLYAVTARTARLSLVEYLR